MERDPPILDYRHPGTGQALSLNRLVSILEQREAALSGIILLKLVLGALGSLIGPLVLASIVAVLPSRLGIEGFPGWTLSFLLACLVMIPGLYWFEWRSRGQFFLDFSRGQSASVEGGMLRTSSRGEWEMQTTLASWAATLEILLFGPRLMLEAMLQHQARANLGRVNRTRAARLLWQLFVRTDGLPVQELAEPSEPPQELARALAYLQLLEYIDLSRKRDRVWMLSSGRRRLERSTGARGAS